jgi:serine/threonine protein kinase
MKKKYYKILSNLGNGAFGDIYKCRNNTNGKEYAMKVESKENKSSEGQIAQECQVYKDFNNIQINQHTMWPKIYERGYNINGYDIMVMDLYGMNLDQLLKQKSFRMNDIIYIAQKIIHLLELFHNNGYVHRDMKPQNFVVSPESIDLECKPEIFLIDYGLAKKLPRKFIQNRSLKGTIRYCSINTHLGVEQTRRDDLIALGYMLLYFINPTNYFLNGIMTKHTEKKQAYDEMMYLKMSSRIEDLCTSSIKDEKLAKNMIQYMFYVESLGYDQVPDYTYCKLLFN